MGALKMGLLNLWRWASVVGIFILLVGIESASGQPSDTVDVIAPNRISYNLGGEILKLPYYRNHALSENTNLHRAVIMVHGTNRNADVYYQTLLDAALLADNAETKSILIAPQFLVEEDIAKIDPADSSELLFWTNSRWKRGSNSIGSAAYPQTAFISSYAVMDSIIYRLATNNANMDTIVIAGHSAGGQYTHRYAAGSNIQSTLEGMGIHLRHVVANPSSYLYFDSARWVSGEVDSFAIPNAGTMASCTTSSGRGYNDYIYGLDKLSQASYMNNVGAATIIEQYKQRWVMYLLGENDVLSGSLDTTCPAFLEGAHRLDRGTKYYKYLDYFYEGSITCKQVIDTIPGVGHSNNDMFTSDCGVFSLFDYGSCVSEPRPCTWVEFNYVGTETGSFDFPFNTLVEGVNSAGAGEEVMIKAGTSSETLLILKHILLRSWNGTAKIGVP
jgi:hypothetical protein